MLKIITIGTDRKLFEENSAVLQRSLEYAQKMEELHIVVFSLVNKKLQRKKIGNLYLYPTNSLCRLFYVFDAFRIGKKIITENKFVRGLSVISSQDPFETGLVGSFLKKKFCLPLQLQIHTDFASPYFKNSFLNVIRVIMSGFLIRRADGLRVVSKKIADALVKKFPHLNVKPEILPIFVDVETLKNSSGSEDLRKNFPQFTFIILMASRLTREKKIDTALYVMKKIVSIFPHTGLIVAGEGNEKSRLKKLAENLGIKDNVCFIGWQNNLIQYYKMANMFMVTSEYEGYGMTIVESVSSGCPVITTNVGIVPEVLIDGENGFICPVGEVDCFTVKIISFMSDNQKRELFKRKMQDSIKSVIMNKNDYVNKYVGLLEIIANKPAKI